MRAVASLLAMATVMMGCTEAVTMRNKTTGEVATCGPYKTASLPALGLRSARRSASLITNARATNGRLR